MIETTNLELARKLIKKEQKPIIIKAQDNLFNRKILEYGKFDILLSPEKGEKKDKLKQLNSGLNHVLAKIAAKNSIALGVDLKEIRSMDKKEKAKQLARIIQNIRICRKSKTRFACINCNNKIDVFNLLISLGASTKQAEEAFKQFIS
ncbi:MAG: hypothetical protein AABX73_04040 [Nanoarchaeota archaeon]